jgi:muramoyltetrapeptide carboxypeptidase LdcA involved in peptidoglycan recycling
LCGFSDITALANALYARDLTSLLQQPGLPGYGQ